MPKQAVILEDDRILLRPLEERDLPLTLSWRNQDHIRKWFLNSSVIPADGHRAWFESYAEREDDYVFVILAKDLERRPVGQISLYRIDWQAGSAEYGRLIVGPPEARGKGYARRATGLLLEHAFTQWKLKDVHLEVREDNAGAIAIYRSAGFVEVDRKDGLLRMAAGNLPGGKRPG
jgi:RimJ/RimL family protein N-acetyltransferase